MKTTKLTFDEVLERIGDERQVNASDVYAKDLNRVLWIAEWHIPGCLSESQCVCTSKRDAIESALSMAEDENGAPRGMKTALIKHNTFYGETSLYGTVVNTVSKMTLAEML